MNERGSMKEAILRKIDDGELKMRPRVFFTLQVAAVALLAFAILMVSILIFNFLAFSIRINSRDVLLSFGPRGLLAFLIFFPWKLLILDAILVFFLQSLLRRFRFAYQRPVLYLLLGLLLVTAAAGVFLDRGTPLNDDLSRRPLPPPFAGMYVLMRHAPPPGSGLCRCTVIAINGNTLTVADSRSTTTMTVILPLDDAHATTSMLEVGDTVFIAGDVDDSGTIHAFGLHRMPASAGETFPAQ